MTMTTQAGSSNEAQVASLGDADFNVRAKALGELVRRGPAASPALRQALNTPDVELRARVVRALAEIADPACANLYADLVSDPDERNRAYAAHALARLRDPRALDALVRTIDDNPDVLHDPETLATYALATMGPAVLPKLAPLLSAPGEATRVRAFHVIRQVVSKLPGTDWAARARALGDYDPRGPAPDRDRAAQQWRDWIAQPFPEMTR
jgi:HEAT repeat protein